MSKIVEFVRKNWLVLIVFGFVLWPYGRNMMGGVATPMMYRSFATSDSVGVAAKSVALGTNLPVTGGGNEVAPVASSDRMTVQETSLSMQVNDVAEVATKTEEIAVKAGGYMVNRSVTKPEGAATGYVVIRIPVEKRQEVLEGIKKLGIKVVNENVYGYDVTDQYTDIQGRLKSLEDTKAKLEALMNKADKVADIVDIQREIGNLQQQIDYYKGQVKYLEGVSKLTRITLDLSTDDLALNYTPDAAWRPAVVFKQAVRSMIASLRGLANSVIWIVTYVPVVLVLVVVLWVVMKIWKKFKK